MLLKHSLASLKKTLVIEILNFIIEYVNVVMRLDPYECWHLTFLRLDVYVLLRVYPIIQICNSLYWYYVGPPIPLILYFSFPFFPSSHSYSNSSMLVYFETLWITTLVNNKITRPIPIHLAIKLSL